MSQPDLAVTSVSLPTAASHLAAAFLAHCLDDALAGLPFDAARVTSLLEDDDVYFLAADQLVDPRLRRRWLALAGHLEGLAGYRAAVLERACGSALRNAFEVIFFGELGLDAERSCAGLTDSLRAPA